MKTDMFHLKVMTPDHWDQVAEIYRNGIDTGIATFETEVPAWEQWNDDHLEVGRFVAVESDDRRKILGWAALSPVSSRCVYGGVAEVSVYVHPAHHGIGVGMALMKQLIESSESAGFWTLQSGIFPENEGSIRLHEKAGFRRIGFRERIGKIDGQWKDNVLMERRSEIVGSDPKK